MEQFIHVKSKITAVHHELPLSKDFKLVLCNNRISN